MAVLLLESKSCVSLMLILPQQACQEFRPLEEVTTQAPWDGTTLHLIAYLTAAAWTSGSSPSAATSL